MRNCSSVEVPAPGGGIECERGTSVVQSPGEIDGAAAPAHGSKTGSGEGAAEVEGAAADADGAAVAPAVRSGDRAAADADGAAAAPSAGGLKVECSRAGCLECSGIGQGRKNVKRTATIVTEDSALIY